MAGLLAKMRPVSSSVYLSHTIGTKTCPDNAKWKPSGWRNSFGPTFTLHGKACHAVREHKICSVLFEARNPSEVLRRRCSLMRRINPHRELASGSTNWCRRLGFWGEDTIWMMGTRFLRFGIGDTVKRKMMRQRYVYQ